jgi:hypothetical protein
MLLMSRLVRPLQRLLKIRGARWVVAALVAAAGIYGIFHATQSGAAAAEGFFCRVAPAWLGR